MSITVQANARGDALSIRWSHAELYEKEEILRDARNAVRGSSSWNSLESPAFVDRSMLDRVGYLESLPSVPLSVSSEKKTQVDYSEVVLAPALCFNMLSQAVENDQQTGLYHSFGSVFRSEASTCPGFDDFRTVAFSMEEFVCIGSESEVGTFLNQATQRLVEYFSAEGVPISHDSATDVFYGEHARAYRLAHRISGTKIELVTPWSQDSNYAIASRNFHGTRLLDATVTGGRGRSSGCLAYGWDRLCLAVFAGRRGTDPRSLLVDQFNMKGS